MNMRSKYVVFCYDRYYPEGGSNDLLYIGSDKSEANDWLNKCVQHLSSLRGDGYAELWDTDIGKGKLVEIEDGKIIGEKEINLSSKLEKHQRLIEYYIK